MSRNSISDAIRDKYLKENLQNIKHPKLSETPGFRSLKKQFFLFESVFSQNYSIFNQMSHKAILIYGMPGVGKTLAANCIASQLNKPVIICDELISSFRQAVVVKPSVLIVEHIDSFEDKQLKQLCSLLDDLKEDVLVIGTSKTEINEELKRNERFEIQILLKGPSLDERAEIISHLLFKSTIEIKKTKVPIKEAVNTDNIGKGERVQLNSILKKHNRAKNERTSEENKMFIDKKEEEKNSLNIKKKVNEENFDVDAKKIAESTPGFLASDLIKLIRLSCTFAFKEGENKLTTDRILKTIEHIKKIDTSLTFDSIGALEEVKEILNLYIILPTLHPESFKRMGISKPSGVLLYGPPGCGKTMIARAVSNMSHCNFISISGPELISKYVGDSEKDLRELFERAKSLSPCIIFFDEIDSLCMKRSDSGFNNRIVNQILTLMDGINSRGEVYLLAATNRLDALDEALIRPGRFDNIVEIRLPNRKECRDIFEKITKNIPMESFPYDELDFGNLALSGADIAGIIKNAGLMAMKRDLSGNSIILKQDIIEALKKFTVRNS